MRANIARFAIERPIYTWILVLVCLFGGIVGIETVGRLEDPAFPIKNALIITPHADVDLAECVEPKQFHDITGGYNRFDVFRLTVDRTAQRPVVFTAGSGGGGTTDGAAPIQINGTVDYNGQHTY